jgi:hypothetical protein
MPQEQPVAAAVQASLHAIGQALREPHPLSAEAQDALADLLDELGNLLAAPEAPPEAVRHLAEGTARLVQAVHARADAGLLAQARDRVERAILAAEVQSPLLAGIARRFLDALANIGI